MNLIKKQIESAQKKDAGKDEHDMSPIEASIYGTNTYSSQDFEFQFEKTGKDLENYIEDIADTVRIGLDQSISILTPWFFSNMPRMYYQTTPRAEKVRHLSAVITGHVFETKQTVELWDQKRTKVTYIGPGTDQTILMAMIKKLVSLKIKLGSLYFSRDRLLFLSTFFADTFKPADLKNNHIIAKVEEAKKLIDLDFPGKENEADRDMFLQNLDHDFVVYATPARLQLTFRMLRHMLSHEGAHTVLEPFENSPSGRLTLGLKGVELSDVIEHVFTLLLKYDFEIVRFFAMKFSAQESGEQIDVMHFILRNGSGENIEKNSINVIKLNKALRTLGWVDSDSFNQLMSPPFDISINGVNLIRAASSWVHIILGKENIYYYSDYKILNTILAHPEVIKKIVDLFHIKFSPLKEKSRVSKEYEGLHEQLNKQIEEIIDRVERHICREFVSFVDHCEKTNYFIPTKTGLAFRISPKILQKKYYPEEPFGIFFIVGKDYRFFQVRWKDVARGGLRIVLPKSKTDYGVAISGLFDEVYALSHAQQLKNKDIPEGGSKAVMVLKPGGVKERAVKGGINALLDLLVQDDETHEEKASKLVTYYKEEEIIYLGPDENMTNDLIEWVPVQAERRGYPYAKAFISSKPGAGINHKEYGVTSEGVHVFVDTVLKFIGIEPKKEKFTIKMTGGPDGDVAGNELKILYREYGENARIIGVADGFGAAFDAEGLDWQELLKLVKLEKSICEFNKALLKSSDAYVIQANTTENIRKRNELHSVVKADIFIPAGGRPYTVNENNYQRFIDEEGNPTCKAIIEGANIFFTKEARNLLQEKGILMIKDSSANKTGVICSSFEIIASLILEDEEFAAIKEKYIEEVIQILRKKAKWEADLLFAEYLKWGKSKSLVELSMDISREINMVTDTLLEQFTSDPERYLNNDLFKNIILGHCPNILKEQYQERIFERLPTPHQIAILAANIASHIVYREGLGWLEKISEGQRFEAAMAYMSADQFAQHLIDSVSASALENKEEIVAVLKSSAARKLTMIKIHGKEVSNGNS